MKKLFPAAALLLSACSVSVPVNGELEGIRAQGTATAALSGGTFYVMSTSGLRCDGTYDAMTSDITITAPVTCNDGRTGNAIISRRADLTSGTVIVKLTGGAQGQFVFGNLSYAEEF